MLIRFYVDKISQKSDQTEVIGWSYHQQLGVLPVRAIDGSNISEPAILPRIDVMLAHDRQDILSCGWIFTFDSNLYPEFKMLVDGIWTTFYKVDNSFKPKINSNPPSYLVVDNFYSDPDAVRAFALTKQFNYHPDYHKGKRTDDRYLFPGLREKFEQLVGRKITRWFEHGVNGVFQYCVETDQLVYHCDSQNYAGIVFLTPDAPPDSGTSLLRSKITKKMKIDDGEHNIVFDNGNGFLNPDLFEVVDSVGNKYNRLVLFDSQHIHAASSYFGTNLENGRLFQLFFFDIAQ